MSQTISPTSTTPAPAPVRRGVPVAVVSILVLTVIVAAALIVFIAQNSAHVQIRYFGANASIGFGVAMLLAAVAGAVIAFLVSAVFRVRRSLRSRS